MQPSPISVDHKLEKFERKLSNDADCAELTQGKKVSREQKFLKTRLGQISTRDEISVRSTGTNHKECDNTRTEHNNKKKTWISMINKG